MKILAIAFSLLIIGNGAAAASLCFEPAESKKSIFQNLVVVFNFFDESGHLLANIVTNSTESNSRPVGSVVKTYVEFARNTEAAKIRFENGVPSKIFEVFSHNELSLTPNSELSDLKQLQCYDIGK